MILEIGRESACELFCIIILAVGIYSYTLESVILESVKIKIFFKSVKMISKVISENICKLHF